MHINPTHTVHRLVTLELINTMIEQCETEIAIARRHAEQSSEQLSIND